MAFLPPAPSLKGRGTKEVRGDSLAPLSFRGATYSGVFTLMPLLSGIGQKNHGHILREAAALADAGKLKPFLNEQHFTADQIEAAHALVESGPLGKVVVDL